MNCWIRVKIHWIDWKTGEEGIYEEPPGENQSAWLDEETGEVDLFQWQENNYCCDHNRVLFFKGEEWEKEHQELGEEFNCASDRFGIMKLWAFCEGSWRETPYKENRPLKWGGVV